MFRCILKGEPIHLSVTKRPSPEKDKAYSFSVSRLYQARNSRFSPYMVQTALRLPSPTVANSGSTDYLPSFAFRCQFKLSNLQNGITISMGK